ncbi:GNAT family N-acetyltransferase [Streptomyces candidus]|uniref:RimJ/RimL family protein N-acetyltransferase n=1 Tax=Streptomyces candidus TaxID=67283 RepID=A0A7X0HH78_9ACTN|nr:GNAT family N-acetyltransferase [Streptomyces candidus]MBB6437516.1 RimJ/RimL family protein N-acetyltransferase [Streptomyces candidus]GHH54420.1 acetyltransferase [Streptomyces candidus]
MGTLSTPEGFVLREWREGDAAALLEACSSSPELARQIGRVRDASDAREWVARRTEHVAAGTAYAFAVTDGRAGPVLGNVAVSAVDRAHDGGWISYWTVEAARGRGVAVAGTRRLADFCFTELGLHRLELGHRTNNPASCAVALRAGFAVEGLERDKLRYGDVRHDVERHARLATDTFVNGG